MLVSFVMYATPSSTTRSWVNMPGAVKRPTSRIPPSRATIEMPPACLRATNACPSDTHTSPTDSSAYGTIPSRTMFHDSR